MTAAPLISVALPTYNGSRYLRGAVASVLAQTCADFELIVVDDCSTDNTAELVAELAASDKRIIALRHEVNRKLPGALNTGFARARGRYFTWTSDDNLLAPEALATLAAYLEANPQVGVVYSEYSFMDENDRPFRRIAVRPTENLAYENVVGSCFLYRREVQEALGGYDEELFLAEDYDFWLRAASRFKVERVQHNLYYHRIHSRSLTESRPEVRARAALALERHLPALIAAHPEARRWLEMGAGLRFQETTGENRHLWAARKAFLQALLSCPGVVARNLSAAQLLRLTVGMHFGNRCVRFWDRYVNQGLLSRWRKAPVRS